MGRMERVNQQMKREIGQILLRDLSDPRVEFVSITRVDVSPDLKNAKVLFSILGPEDQARDALSCLQNASGMIRRLVSKKMNMRNTPELRFIYDNSLAASAQIEETLKELQDEKTDNEDH